MQSNIIVWLIGLPLASSPIVYIFGRVAARVAEKTHSINPARWLSLLALLFAWAPLVGSYQRFQSEGAFTYTFGSIALRVDGLSLLLSVVVLLLSTLVALFSGEYLAGEQGEEKYYALLVAMTGAIIGLACANDLFNLWVWFETMAIASFMLVAFYREENGALEAGVKYLVQSATGSVLVLVGIALVLGVTGRLDLDGMRQVVKMGTNSQAFLAAGALFITGFGVKAALVPLHTWLPDAHSQAPSGISAMLSGVVIEAGLVAMLRALAPLVSVTNSWGPLLIAFGAANMLLGNLMALRQTQVKRLLAFSSLTHVGYMLLGIGVGITFNTVNGAQGGLFHLLNHAMMKGLAFLAAGALLYALFASRGLHNPLTINDLKGASRRYPLVTLTLSIALLGLGGLPPFSGFMSKWQIFLAGFETQNGWAMAVVIFAALNSVLSLGYYAPLVNAMYRHEPSEAVKTGLAIPWGMGLPLILLAAGIVVLGVWPSLADSITIPAGKALLGMFGSGA
ncbi:MAG: complex I subunit 5 family protein [Anaerolineaceae bacterium]|nr:complex I subunit 5 family protein [Anaerolineaceae bacterium]